MNLFLTPFIAVFIVLGRVEETKAFTPSIASIHVKHQFQGVDLNINQPRTTSKQKLIIYESKGGIESNVGSSEPESLSEIFTALQANIEDGEVGSRGEIYFILQILLVFCILTGTIPVVGDLVELALGPGLILLGGSVATIGVVELGTNLTPWPSPPKSGSLITSGLVFNEIRHPIYAGLIIFMFGLSMWSGSAMRVLLCIVLWYLLDFKSELEEEELIRKFGVDYINYRERVQGKFLPYRLTEGIENAATMMGRNDESKSSTE